MCIACFPFVFFSSSFWAPINLPHVVLGFPLHEMFLKLRMND
jgi:hypothetical protein